MPNDTDTHRQQMRIDAPIQRVYSALTTPQGLRGWWTQDCETTAMTIGQAFTVRFDKTFKTMRVDFLDPPTRVGWAVTQACLDVPGGLSRPDEWVGTSIAFDLAEESVSRTCVHLSHRGLNPQFECYDICTQGWTHFLGSLKQFTETGRGSPYITTPRMPA